MLEMFRQAVAGAKRNGRHVGICGEAPANYPEIARYLTQLGIDSISVNPSSVFRTMAVVVEAEAGPATAKTSRARYRAVIPSSGNRYASETRKQTAVVLLAVAQHAEPERHAARAEKDDFAHTPIAVPFPRRHAASAANSCICSASALTAVIVCVSSW